jgi:thiamine-phosphate pyrophosphorylase
LKPVVVLVMDAARPLERHARAIRAAASALGAGALAFQLRDKDAGPEALARAARSLRAVTREAGALLLVNGDACVAIEAGADGVHVPGGGSVSTARRALGASALVTAAAHADDDVRRARDEGADAVLVSPIFETPGKGPPRGPDALARARAIAGDALGVYALGGVDAARAASCAAAGADGVAVIRALLDAADPAEVARALAAPFAASAARPAEPRSSAR